MRIIKFRIWNNVGECFHDWRELVEKNKIHLLADQQTCYPVMQFTGLTDINGVEIYEGDIVSIPYVNPLGALTEDVDYLTDVVYENGCFCIFSSYQKCERAPIYNALEQASGHYMPNHGNLKVIGRFIGNVIGNIYQNPELLK